MLTRGIGIVIAACTLAFVALLTTMANRAPGPTSAAVTNAESQAFAPAAVEAFQPLDQALQVAKAQTGTYVGAQVPVGNGVTVTQASTTSYCLVVNLSGTLVHKHGPGGTPAIGAAC